MNGATRVRTTHRSGYWHVNNVFEHENTRVVLAEQNNAYAYVTNFEKKNLCPKLLQETSYSKIILNDFYLF